MFHWNVTTLLMHALILYCSTSNNSRHSFVQPNCKSIMVLPINVKEFDQFCSAIRCLFFVQISSKVVNFVFRLNCYFSNFVRFSSKTNFLCHSVDMGRLVVHAHRRVRSYFTTRQWKRPGIGWSCFSSSTSPSRRPTSPRSCPSSTPARWSSLTSPSTSCSCRMWRQTRRHVHGRYDRQLPDVVRAERWSDHGRQADRCQLPARLVSDRCRVGDSFRLRSFHDWSQRRTYSVREVLTEKFGRVLS